MNHYAAHFKTTGALASDQNGEQRNNRAGMHVYSNLKNAADYQTRLN